MQTIVERVLESFREKNFEFNLDTSIGRYPQTITIWGRSAIREGHQYSCRLQYSDNRNPDEIECFEVCRCEVWESARGSEGNTVFDFDLKARYHFVLQEEAKYSWTGRELRPARWDYELAEPLSEDFVRMRTFVRNLAEQLIAAEHEAERARQEFSRKSEAELQTQLREQYWSEIRPRS
jgi:hypothetical protein